MSYNTTQRTGQAAPSEVAQEDASQAARMTPSSLGPRQDIPNQDKLPENQPSEEQTSVVPEQESGEEQEQRLESEQQEAEQEREKSEEEIRRAEQEYKLSERFTALSKKERQLQQQASQIKEQKAQIDKFNAAMEKAKSGEDPLAVLDFAGVSVDDFINALAGEPGQSRNQAESEENSGEDDKYSALEKQIQDLKAELEEKEEKAKQDNINETIEAFKDEIKETVDANPDKFELVKEMESQDAVFDVIEEWYNEYGEVLDIQDAAQRVEDYLTQEAKKIMGLKKFSQSSTQEKSDAISSDQVSQPSSSPVNASSPQESVRARPTISNENIGSQRSSDGPVLDREASLREAAKLLRWNN